MSKFTKLLLGFFAIVVCFVIAVFALFWVLALWPDAPPPPDSAMLPKWKEHSGAGPLADFQIWLRTHPIANSDPRYARLGKKETWNAKEAGEFLSAYRDILDRLNALLDTDPATWSVLNAPQVTLAAGPESVESLNRLVILEQIQIRLLAHQGKFNEAAAEAKKLVRMGQGIQGADGTWIHHLIGLTFVLKGIDSFSIIAETGGGNSQDSAQWQSFVAGIELKEEDLQHTAQVEYLAFKRMIEALKRGDFNPESILPKGAPSKVTLVKPNATDQLYLDLLAPLLTACQEHQGWAPVGAAGDDLYDKIGEMKSSWFKMFVSSNAVGKVMVFISLPAIKQMLLKEFSSQAKVRQAACSIALHRYELEEGKLPDQLSQLVPKYLPDVPLDPFDLKPMKWNSKTFIIYAVGENLKDDGGQIDEVHYSKAKDVGERYWWRPAAKK